MAYNILLIEDDANIRSFASTVLQSNGFAVTACETATQGLKFFSKKRSDLIIVDIGLPDGSGIDVCKMTRTGVGPFIPVIFLTAKGDLQTRLAAFEVGAQDYIQKPFAIEELLARVKVHLKIKESQDELARRNYDLEILHRVQQDLSDMIVHDLKAPLTSIKGTLDIIKSRGLISEDTYKNLLSNAGEAADFMLLMVNDILDIGRSEQRALPVELSQVSVETMMEKLKSLFNPACHRKNIQIVSTIDSQAKTLTTDANLFFRILVNLTSNAVKFTPKGQDVELTGSKVNNKIRFSVFDRGPGIPPHLKNHIFDKYAVGHSKLAAESLGMGIGLAFCRLAVTTLGGTIFVEDRQGGGSRFTVELEAK